MEKKITTAQILNIVKNAVCQYNTKPLHTNLDEIKIMCDKIIRLDNNLEYNIIIFLIKEHLKIVSNEESKYISIYIINNINYLIK